MKDFEKEIDQLKEDYAQLHMNWQRLMISYSDMSKRDLLYILEDQSKFSLETFGPGQRTQGLVDHITKELREVEKEPDDLMEWIDITILAFDGAWRSGHTPNEIVDAYKEKIARNKLRNWPDWRTADPNKAIEHVRNEE